MAEGRAQYRDAAARWLRKARAAVQATGRPKEWRHFLTGLLTRHQRKYKLVPRLRALQ